MPSFLGLSVTVGFGAGASVLATLETDDRGDPCSSLTVTVPRTPDRADVPGVTLTFHAATPGAFVDLSADLAFLTGRPLADVVTDDEPVAGPHSAAANLAGLSAINQAIGALIGRGRTAEQAREELTRRAAAAGTNHHGAAELIFRDLGAGGAAPDPGPAAPLRIPPAADRPRRDAGGTSLTWSG